jgi:Co/Zn/Cd efflux system component
MGVSVKPSRISFGAHPLLKLYTVLTFSSVYFCGQLYVAYISKSLTLQADAYYMLCNILFLITAIVRTQVRDSYLLQSEMSKYLQIFNVVLSFVVIPKMCRKGRDVRNTFGWTRIDVCGAVGGFCFLAALFFSTSVETIQVITSAIFYLIQIRSQQYTSP